MPSEVDVFPFFLAEKLGKTVAEIEQIGHAEMVGWMAYHEAMNAMGNMKEAGI